jgi:hypothetical protein
MNARNCRAVHQPPDRLPSCGISGGEYGVRGFIDAYDASTGKRAWRFHTVPAPGEPGNSTWVGDSWKRGGAPAWITGTFDPSLNLIFWPTGNPSPSDDTSVRGGDNLYSNCVLALDADTRTAVACGAPIAPRAAATSLQAGTNELTDADPRRRGLPLGPKTIPADAAPATPSPADRPQPLRP